MDSHAHQDDQLDPILRLHPGQEALTPAQEAEAQRFADECIRTQLSTDPVDEPQTVALLRQAYQVAGLEPPKQIIWLDGPLQFVTETAPQSVWGSVEDSVWASVRAYHETPWLAVYHFFAEYLAPNDLQALAHFNERVSGHRLGRAVALLVRRPTALCRDAAGRLHSATGKCLEYRDGWGCYAWHGVRVPERVILAPETLTRDDFLNERDVEVRRAIQERMGDRFVSELGGVVLDSGPRGTLYEVRLPAADPERVARYVQVQDVSTERRYVLRVPPSIQTATEAVAWSFALSAEEYAPKQET